MTPMSATESPGIPTAVPEDPSKVETLSTDEPKTPLTPAELKARLRLGSIELVAELWAITQKQIDVEVARHGRLEGKATSLLTAIGLSLTVAFTFGATLMGKATEFATVRTWTIGFYGAAIVAGLAAAGFALRALFLTEQKQVSERSIFNAAILKNSDRWEEKDEKEGLMRYRQAQILHYWDIRNQYDRTYRRKAWWVKGGQVCFGLFLLALLSLCIPVTIAVISAKHDSSARAEGPNGAASSEADRRGQPGHVAPGRERQPAPASPAGSASPAEAQGQVGGSGGAEAQGSPRPSAAGAGVGNVGPLH